MAEVKTVFVLVGGYLNGCNMPAQALHGVFPTLEKAVLGAKEFAYRDTAYIQEIAFDYLDARPIHQWRMLHHDRPVIKDF